jgi:AraC-like DNA-binding protein
MLEADGRVDCYLFDESGQPIPFRTLKHSTEPLEQLCWGLMWEQAISHPVLQGAEDLAEYMIKTMSDKLGLSEATIREQFNEQYGHTGRQNSGG